MTRRRTVLFTVSEYGEFFSLLGLADGMASGFGIHPVFVFRFDYGALTRHAEIVEGRGYSWASEKNAELRFDMSASDMGGDDYVPHLPVAERGEVRADVPRPQKVGVSLRPKTMAIPAKRRSLLRSLIAFDNLVIVPLRLAAVALYLLSWPLRILFSLLLRSLKAADQQRRISRIQPLAQLRFALRHRQRVVRRIFAIFDPVLVVSGQDYPLSLTAIAAKFGEERGVQTAIVPFSMTPTTKEVAESFAGRRINLVGSRYQKRFLQRVAPNWLHVYRGRTYKRLGLADILRAEFNDLAPPQPWTPNSGRGIVMAPSRQSVDYCLSAGIPEQQLRLTGAAWLDDLAARAGTRDLRRSRLLRNIRMFRNFLDLRRQTNRFFGDSVPEKTSTGERKLVVISWPPNQWPRNASGFPTYEAFSEALVDALADAAQTDNVDFAVSLHPTLVGTSIARSIRESGVYVLDADLIDIIDCADIFCATVSSTLLWSLSLGIPSVNFDPYRYFYREFRQAGMLEASTIGQLRECLSDLLMDEDFYLASKAKMDASKDYWTLGEAGSRERIFGEMQKLIESEPENRQSG